MSCYSCDAPLYCERCLDRHDLGIENECKKKSEEIKPKFDLYEAKLRFLSLPFDSEPANKMREGDVIFTVKGRSDEALHAHKFVLTTRSAVFAKMFETEMLEGETGVVRIDDATLPVMRAVIKFCYDAQITFTEDVTAEDVLVVAHKYIITFLHRTCEEHLIQTLNHHNLPKRLRLAKRFDAPSLETAASKYLKDHFDSVISEVLTELC